MLKVMMELNFNMILSITTEMVVKWKTEFVQK